VVVSQLEWLILFVGYQAPGADEPPELDRLMLQKGLFLLRQAGAIPEQEAYDFRPDDFGPVSYQIYQDTDELLATHLLRETRQGGPRWWYYQATPAGRAVAADLAQRASPRTLSRLEVVRGLLKQLPFNQIVSGIYATFPDYAVATTARDLLPDGSKAASKEIAELFRPDEICIRAEALLGMRQIERGEYVTREQMASVLRHGT
jgi:hypothetical protein